MKGYSVKNGNGTFDEIISTTKYLENIVGRKNLLEYLKNTKQFTESDVENIFRNVSDIIYFDNKNNLLIDEQSDFLIKKFSPQIKLTYLEVLKKFGIITLREVLETGLTKAN